MSARPARTDRGHESVREVQYRERGRALRELRAALRSLVAREPIGFDAEGQIRCAHCGRDPFPSGAGHEAHCPVVLAREALARWQGVNDTDNE